MLHNSDFINIFLEEICVLFINTFHVCMFFGIHGIHYIGKINNGALLIYLGWVPNLFGRNPIQAVYCCVQDTDWMQNQWGSAVIYPVRWSLLEHIIRDYLPTHQFKFLKVVNSFEDQVFKKMQLNTFF